MDVEVEKLEIDKEKIIHILLKHLMYQRNEIAYINNKMDLQTVDNNILANSEGSKLSTGGISDLGEGSKPLLFDKEDLREGSKQLLFDNVDLPEGSKLLLSDNVDLQEGSKPLLFDNVDLREGSKPLLGGKWGFPEGGKTDFWLHNVFEKRLIEALEQYIRNGNGQNSLYAFYADFENAVKEQNDEAGQMKEAAKQIPLEETHILPAQIPVDNISLSLLRTALQEHLPPATNYGQYNTVAKELLCLHNAGKATTTQMRSFGGLSEGGIAKHLPRLQRAGLIKKQPPGNYGLTQKSTHILLKLFGVAKK